MLNIFVNLETGVATLSQTTAIKAGGGVPCIITFSQSPGTDPAIELALSAQSSSPIILAYANAFTAQNETVYSGTLDANDSRLLSALASTASQTLNCEIILTAAGEERQIFPNFPVTVQKSVISGDPSTEGGPTFLAQGVASGAARITSGGLEIYDTSTHVWRLVTFVAGTITYTEV
jgi:hypothetical protein